MERGPDEHERLMREMQAGHITESPKHLIGVMLNLVHRLRGIEDLVEDHEVRLTATEQRQDKYQQSVAELRIHFDAELVGLKYQVGEVAHSTQEIGLVAKRLDTLIRIDDDGTGPPIVGQLREIKEYVKQHQLEHEGIHSRYVTLAFKGVEILMMVLLLYIAYKLGLAPGKV